MCVCINDFCPFKNRGEVRSKKEKEIEREKAFVEKRTDLGFEMSSFFFAVRNFYTDRRPVERRKREAP